MESYVVPTGEYEGLFENTHLQRVMLGENLYDNSFYDHPRREFIKNNAEENIRSISKIIHLYEEYKEVFGFLPFSDDLLKVLGAYKDKNGVIQLGPGYDEAEYILEKLIPDIRSISIDYEQDNKIYELFSIQQRPDKQDGYIIQNMGFRYEKYNRKTGKWENTRKQWFEKWLIVFQNIDKNTLDLNNELDTKIYNALFDENGNNIFDGAEINTQTNQLSFTDAELETAIKVKEIMVSLFRQHIFREIYSGSIFPKYGRIRFMSQTWRTIYKSTNKDTKLKLPLERIGKGAQAGKYTPNKDALLGAKIRYLLGRLAFEYSIELAKTDGTVAKLDVSGVPKELLMPQFKDPTKVKDKSLLYAQELDYLCKIFGEAPKPKFSMDEGKLLIHEALLKKLEDKYQYKSEISFIEKNIRWKIFTDDDYSPTGGRAFRKTLLDWLTARGTYTIPELYYYGKKHYITLTPEDFKKYFQDDYDKMIYSLKKIALFGGGSVLEEKIALSKQNLIKMQDFIIDILGFVKEMSDLAGGKKIILYPFKGYKDGFGIVEGQTYIPDPVYLKETHKEALDEWWISTKDPKKIGFIFDPDQPKRFQDLIPEFLALLFVEPCAFVVRVPGEGMARDEVFFGFEITGSLAPAQLRGKYGYNGPPGTGMIAWNKLIYEYLAYRLNDIVNRYDLLGIHRFRDPNKFYDICRDKTDPQMGFLRDFSYENLF